MKITCFFEGFVRASFLVYVASPVLSSRGRHYGIRGFLEAEARFTPGLLFQAARLYVARSCDGMYFINFQTVAGKYWCCQPCVP